jgi:protein-tyrosine phosphatase
MQADRQALFLRSAPRRHFTAALLVALSSGCAWSNERECPAGPERSCVQGSLQQAPSAVDGSAQDAAAERDAGLTAERAILVGEVVNARDLGGTPLPDGAEVRRRVLFRGPPLVGLSPDGCAAVAALGVRTVIDLRTDDARAAAPNDPCVHDQANVIDAPLPIPYDVSPEDYVADLNTTDSIALAFQALGDAEAYPIYFHCTWGRDRTGVLAAVILSALGADRGAIMDDYLLSRATVGAYPESLSAVLDELEQRGGIDAYLADAGIARAWVDTLRARAITRAQ